MFGVCQREALLTFQQADMLSGVEAAEKRLAAMDTMKGSIRHSGDLFR